MSFLAGVVVGLLAAPAALAVLVLYLHARGRRRRAAWARESIQ